MTPQRPEPADLAMVMKRARLLWSDPVAEIWLRSPNAHLGHARPIDVLAIRGPDEVLDALDAAIAGAYA